MINEINRSILANDKLLKLHEAYKYFYNQQYDKALDKFLLLNKMSKEKIYNINIFICKNKIKTNPFVSIVVPIYNSSKYLYQCLNSIVNQSLKNIEIICVDNGSTDSSLEIVKQYKRKDSRIRYFIYKYGYAGGARNTGIRYAKGKYILFVDADDWCKPNLLEEAYYYAESTSSDIVLFDFIKISTRMDKQQKIKCFKNIERPNKKIFNKLDCQESIFNITTPAPYNKLFLLNFIKKHNIKYQEIHNSNDLYFVLMSLYFAERISYLSKYLYYYRIDSTNSLQHIKHKHPECFIYAYLSLYEAINRNNASKKILESYAHFLISGLNFNFSTFKNYVVDSKFISEAFKTLVVDTNIENIITNAEYKYQNDKKYTRYYKSICILDEYINNSVKCEVKCIKIDKVRNPKISIIVFVYNCEKFLEKCLVSIQNQKLQNIQIICIDDGSTDNSLSTLITLVQHDERVSIYTQNNLGVCCARNIGIKHSKGEYIYFVDSNDMLDVFALENLYLHAKNNKLDILFFDAMPFITNNERNNGLNSFKFCKKYFSRHKNYDEIYNGFDLFAKMYYNEDYIPSAQIYIVSRKYLFERQLSFQKYILHGDNDFTFKLLLFAKRVGYIKKNFCKKRVQSYLTSTMNNRLFSCYGYFKNFCNMMTFLDNVEIDIDYHSIYEYFAKILKKCQKIYLSLDDTEQNFYKFLHSKESALFEFYIVNSNKIQSLHKYIDKINPMLIYISARFDIKNFGTSHNDLSFDNISTQNYYLQCPMWFRDNFGIGYCLESSQGYIAFTIKCIGDGTLLIKLRGCDIRSHDIQEEVYICFEFLKINDYNILDNNICVSHKNYYEHKINVKNDDVLEITARWKPPNS